MGHCPLHLPGQEPGLSELEEISVSSTPAHGETEAQGVEWFAQSHPAWQGKRGYRVGSEGRKTRLRALRCSSRAV